MELKPGTGSAPAIVAPAMFQADPMRGEGGRPGAGRGAVKALSVDRFSVNFTADGEFRELLDEVRALMSHSEPKGDLLTVMKRGLEALRSELLKKRFGVGKRPRRVQLRKGEGRFTTESVELKPAMRTRYVPAAVAREVYVRDQGRCTFCADGGRRCGERRLLQLDHVVPHAKGGEPTLGNLRLRCRAHNLHTARAYFGKEYVRAAAKRARESTGHAGSQDPAARGRPRRTNVSDS
jgi:5-methylcytosine-specific restriction endonuclease McrA